MSELKTASYHKPGQGSISAEVKVHVKHMVDGLVRLTGKLHCAAGYQELLRDETLSFLQRVQSLFGKPQSELA